jgi:hypothetical protein
MKFSDDLCAHTSATNKRSSQKCLSELPNCVHDANGLVQAASRRQHHVISALGSGRSEKHCSQRHAVEHPRLFNARERPPNTTVMTTHCCAPRKTAQRTCGASHSLYVGTPAVCVFVASYVLAAL